MGDKNQKTIEVELGPSPELTKNKSNTNGNQEEAKAGDLGIKQVRSSDINQVEIVVQDEQKPDSSKKAERKLQYSFFIFVNPKSGGGRASVLTKVDIEKMVFSTFHPKDADVQLSIYSLIDSVSRDTGMRALKEEQEKNKPYVRVIIGGGDGTIMWAIEEMIRYGIQFDRCPIGTIPFGTGNDFSRVTGWGAAEPSPVMGTHLAGMKKLITKWADSIIEDFDIWDVTIDCYPEGGIRYISKEKRSFHKLYKTESESDKRILRFHKKMSNYFSFGVDSRIGYGFDKSRTSNRCCNKVVYCWEGFKKMFKSTRKVNDLLEDCQKLKLENGQEVPLQEIKDEVKISGDDFILYPSSQKEKKETEKGKHNVYIKGNPAVFLCHNIPSYMAGCNPWGASRGKVGSTDAEGKKVKDFDDQNFGDSKLEIMGFGGPIGLAAERFLKGRAKRLWQATGPLKLQFKETDKKGKPMKTYMQIDGEYYEVLAPKSVRISLTSSIPRGKIKVMVNSDKTKS